MTKLTIDQYLIVNRAVTRLNYVKAGANGFGSREADPHCTNAAAIRSGHGSTVSSTALSSLESSAVCGTYC
jgi:hypothetical protein